MILEKSSNTLLLEDLFQPWQMSFKMRKCLNRGQMWSWHQTFECKSWTNLRSCFSWSSISAMCFCMTSFWALTSLMISSEMGSLLVTLPWILFFKTSTTLFVIVLGQGCFSTSRPLCIMIVFSLLLETSIKSRYTTFLKLQVFLLMSLTPLKYFPIRGRVFKFR